MLNRVGPAENMYYMGCRCPTGIVTHEKMTYKSSQSQWLENDLDQNQCSSRTGTYGNAVPVLFFIPRKQKVTGVESLEIKYMKVVS